AGGHTTIGAADLTAWQTLHERPRNEFYAWVGLANNQHFANVVAGEEELDGGKVTEQGLDMAVIEYALQAEAMPNRGMQRAGWPAPYLAPGLDMLHFQ